MKNVRVARRYARGLMAAAVEEQTLERTGVDLELVGQVLRDSREFRMLVASPVVSSTKKLEVFQSLLGRHLAPTTLAFVRMMTEKNREGLLSDVVEQFRILRDERLGIVAVQVTSAVEVAQAQKDQLSALLQQYTGKKVWVRFAIDTQIKGGLVVRIADTVLDTSLRRQLELLRGRLAAGGPLTN
jgi:F-type H+-transporting ATPase subunit delta